MLQVPIHKVIFTDFGLNHRSDTTGPSGVARVESMPPMDSLAGHAYRTIARLDNHEWFENVWVERLEFWDWR